MKPMLAASAEPEHIQSGYLVSPKLDGIRAVHTGGALLTRSLKPVPNRHLQARWSADVLHGLDGELILGDPTAPDVFRQTTSAVMSHAGEPEATFYAFDDFTEPFRPFAERLERLQARVTDLVRQGYPIVLVPHIAVSANDPLERIESAFLGEGYEGLIARHPAKTYKFGRSTVREASLLKLKRFSDGEAVIVRAVELMRNGNEAVTNELGCAERSTAQAGLIPGGTLGALEVKDLETGVEFAIGSGFDQATRDRLWAERDSLTGRIVSYRHFPIGAYDKPRFPTFKGLRDPADLAA